MFNFNQNIVLIYRFENFEPNNRKVPTVYNAELNL